MKNNNVLEIVEFPNETLLTRTQVKEILKISYAQLDSHIPDSELPRTRMNGHTFVYRDDLAAYIQAHGSDGSSSGIFCRKRFRKGNSLNKK